MKRLQAHKGLQTARYRTGQNLPHAASPGAGHGPVLIGADAPAKRSTSKRCDGIGCIPGDGQENEACRTPDRSQVAGTAGKCGGGSAAGAERPGPLARCTWGSSAGARGAVEGKRGAEETSSTSLDMSVSDETDMSSQCLVLLCSRAVCF